MIVAMSSWLNAAALAGSAAVEQHLAITLEDYTSRPRPGAWRMRIRRSCRSLPDIQRAGGAVRNGWPRRSRIPAR
jgi:hypothetical protein